MNYLKPIAAAVVAAVGFSLGGCNFAPLDRTQASANSQDYLASRPATDARVQVRAFVYGQTTVLEFTAFPAFLVIRDDQNRPVEFTRIGNYARMLGKLDHFTVWANGQGTTFASTRTTTPTFSKTAAPDWNRCAIVDDPQAEAATGQPIVRCADDEHDKAEADTAAWVASLSEQAMIPAKLGEPHQPATATGLAAQFVQRCKAQLAALWDAATGNDAAMRARLADQSERLDRGVSVTLHVTFEPGSHGFAPDHTLRSELLQAASLAPRIYVRAFTDATTETGRGAALAARRAESTRRWLIQNGIDSGKIRATSQAFGGWISPNVPGIKGKNRRVEIELIHP